MDKHSILTTQLGSISDWITNADSKASYVLTFNAALFGFIGWMFSFYTVTSCLEFIVAGLFLVSFLISTYKAFRVLVPNVKPAAGAGGHWFFGSIAQIGLEDYKKWVNSAESDDIVEELSEQIHTTSKIALNKFNLIRSSLIGLVFAFLFGVLFFSLLILGS